MAARPRSGTVPVIAAVFLDEAVTEGVLCPRRERWVARVPRFFFHVLDGVSQPDDEGTELADRETARVEAIRLAGTILKDGAASLPPGGNWRLEVADASGTILFRAAFSVVALAAPESGAR